MYFSFAYEAADIFALPALIISPAISIFSFHFSLFASAARTIRFQAAIALHYGYHFATFFAGQNAF